MKGNSNSKKTTEEKKKEELKNEIRSYLNDYQSINEDTTITENTKMVLSMLLYTGNGQDKFTIGYRYIEEVTGISKNSISPIVGKLEKKGFINRTKGTRGKNSEYTLNYETMESYVSNCPSVQVSKCTTKKHKKGVQVSKCPSVQPNETTCTHTCTVKDADIQLLIKQNEEKIQLNKRTNELLEKLCNLYININNNINKNLKDNISSNNNTEEYNLKDQEKKKNISTGNLEKLKENSKDENSNDEIIPSGMKDSSEDKDNTSKDKLLYNENPDNENNIPSDENENPNDMPPLDVDSLFEDNSNPLTEYRTNENLNEENETSRDENSKENENPSKANGSSKEDGGLSEDKNPSDENPSNANENPEDDEMDCSVFGDSNSADEDKDNDKWYESSRSSKSDNHENGMFTNLISELTSNENPEDNEISNDNNSKTSENMKKTNNKTNNKTNTIPSEVKNPSDEKTLKNFNAFGKLQSFRDLKTGRIDGYQFNSYDNLNDSRDYSKSFHASVLCLNLEPSDLKKVSVSDTGVWGMLSRKDGVYSFIPSNVGPSYAPNNALQGDETSKVDNHTAEGEIIAPEQSQIANKASEGNTNTTADDKKDGKATEIPNADEKNAEVGNHTTNEVITAGNSVKMRPEPSDSNTNTEKVDSTQSQIANKASNAYADVLEDDAETIAIRERVMRQNAARAQQSQQTEKKSDDNAPKVLDYYKRTPNGWKEIPVHITMENKKMTMGEALELYKNFDNPLKYIYSIMRYVQDFCDKMKCALRLKAITDEQFNAFKNELDYISERYKAYWRKRFSYQEPDPNSSAEKDMHRWLGSPKVTQGKN